MKFGVRECCDVVFKAKAAQKVGKKVFYKGEPVCYFDTLKTSTLEGSGSTVYAQGGHGNARLMSWDGDRAVTFTMEDALISAEGIMILTGAGLIEAGDKGKVIYQHITETVDKSYVKGDAETSETLTIGIDKKPYLPQDEGDNFAYVMFVKDGEIVSEPYIPSHVGKTTTTGSAEAGDLKTEYTDGIGAKNSDDKYEITIASKWNYAAGKKGAADADNYKTIDITYTVNNTEKTRKFPDFDSVIVDYYTPKYDKAKQIEITAESFGGNYYVEASTLFRNEAGVDMPAEFIIPNCRVQSNFSFTMASTGDPSSFSFTMDAFPDYTKFDRSKKVLAAIQIIEEGGADVNLIRTQTVHDPDHDSEIKNK